MHETDPPRAHGELPAETALAVLGNEIRASILWTLSRARGGDGPPPVLSFSELRERAAPDARSSRFNYHLQELVDRYIEKVTPETVPADTAYPVPSMPGTVETDAEAGYRLTPEGTTLLRRIRAWVTDADPSGRRIPIDFDCHYCDTPVKARYDAAHVVVQCPGCEYLYDHNHTPPGVFAADPEETVERVAAYNHHVRRAFARGYCPNCGDTVDVEFQDPAATGYPRADRRTLLVRRGCSTCGAKDNLTAGEVALREPRVLAFLDEQGVDITTPIWELPFAATDRHTTVSRDPLRVQVTVHGGSEPLRVIFDEELTTVGIERLAD